MSARPTIGTPTRLLLILTLALLPFGLLLVMSAIDTIREANAAERRDSAYQVQLAADALDSLFARNALALRIAGSAALSGGPGGACERAGTALALSPGVARTLELEGSDGRVICTTADFADLDRPPLADPGIIRIWLANDGKSVLLRTGVPGGSATTRVSAELLREAAAGPVTDKGSLSLRDDRIAMTLVPGKRDGRSALHREVPIGNGELTLVADVPVPSIDLRQKLAILLPLLMWAVAAIVGWWLVHRFLTDPLRRLQRAVSDFDPDQRQPFAMPAGIGSAVEIRDLGESFARVIDKLEESEGRMADALEGQRRLVREVHHRVKNNLQVVASLLSIHGRTAEQPEAKDAYAAISRRVGALSVVHRNHFADVEEQQGIALRPMISELVAELRATVPERRRPMGIDSDILPASTTQDAAVAAAFLITEVVEYAMLHGQPGQAVDISLSRVNELSARLCIASEVLVGEAADGDNARRQFERVVEGLARQLRSPLDRKMGRYSVDLPVFPER